MAEFTTVALKILRGLPKGSTASYSGQATFYLTKVGDNMWHLDKVDGGLNIVTDGYLADKNPFINEAQE